MVGGNAVLFPVTVGSTAGDIAYTVPGTTVTHVITGLEPSAGYNVATVVAGDAIVVTVASGGSYRTDEGGVLVVGDLPTLLGDAALAFTSEAGPLVRVTADEQVGQESVEEESAGEPVNVTAMPDTPKEDAAALAGAGWIVYEATDAEGVRHLYRVAATPGAVPEDLTGALDAIGGPGIDEAIVISPDGEWLALGAARFHEQCEGWPCLAVAPADLSGGEAVLVAGEAIHPDGWGIVANDGELVVYPQSGGPPALDLWALRREGEGWSAPRLLTGASPYAFNHTAALSADGTRLVFDCGDESYAGAGTAVCEVATDETGFRVVVSPGDGPLGSPDAALHHPDYEPDGGIVFQASWDGGLWRMAAGATEPQPVGAVPNGDNAPCVMADGRIASIWYGRPGSDGTPDLKLTTPDGSSYAVLVAATAIEDINCGG